MHAGTGLRLTHTDPWRAPPECWSSWHQYFRRQWQWQQGRPQFLPADQILQRKQQGQTGGQDRGVPGVRMGSDWGSGWGSDWDFHNVRLTGSHVGPLGTASTTWQAAALHAAIGGFECTSANIVHGVGATCLFDC